MNSKDGDKAPNMAKAIAMLAKSLSALKKSSTWMKVQEPEPYKELILTSSNLS